jgi:DNA-binding MarR family transcriptional regulator
VVKEKSPHDGRVVFVRLTKKGLRIDRIHQYFHRRMVDEVANEMSDHEKEVLIHGMEKLNDFFKGKLSIIHNRE